jgi:hypothetical protein
MITVALREMASDPKGAEAMRRSMMALIDNGKPRFFNFLSKNPARFATVVVLPTPPFSVGIPLSQVANLRSILPAIR